MIQTEGDQQWSLLGHKRPFRNRYSKFLNGRLAAKHGPWQVAGNSSDKWVGQGRLKANPDELLS